MASSQRGRKDKRGFGLVITRPRRGVESGLHSSRPTSPRPFATGVGKTNPPSGATLMCYHLGSYSNCWPESGIVMMQGFSLPRKGTPTPCIDNKDTFWTILYSSRRWPSIPRFLETQAYHCSIPTASYGIHMADIETYGVIG